MEQREIYADTIGQLHYASGVVRFDFISLVPAGEGVPANPEKTFFVTVSTAGFIRAYNAMHDFIGKLVDAGLLESVESNLKPVSVEKAAFAPQAERKRIGKALKKKKQSVRK